MPTSERPKRPGHYWLRIGAGCEQIVEIYDDGREQGLRVDYHGDPILLADPSWDGCEWEGPIPRMGELSEMVAALEPFARMAAYLDGEPHGAVYDGWIALDSPAIRDVADIKMTTVGDVRRVAEIYRRTRAGG